MTIQKCDGCGAEMPPGSRPTIESMLFTIPQQNGEQRTIDAEIRLHHRYCTTGIHFCLKCQVNAFAARVNAMKEAL